MLSMANAFIGGFAVNGGLHSLADGRSGIGILLIVLGLINVIIGTVNK